VTKKSDQEVAQSGNQGVMESKEQSASASGSVCFCSPPRHRSRPILCISTYDNKTANMPPRPA